MLTSLDVRETTKTFFTLGHLSRALSTLFLRGTILPPLNPSFAVITKWESQSIILSARLSGENPPNTTE